MTECNICITKYNKSVNKEVKCLYCNYSCCLTCVKRMMIDMGEECPDCKKGWSREFIRSNTPKVWFDGEYKEKRKEAMFEREKALLQTAIPVIKAEQYSDKIKKELTEITAKLKELEIRKQHLDLELRHNTARLRQGLEIEEVDEKTMTVHEMTYTDKRKVHFIKACPINDCRGFLSTSWKCEVCETWVCKDCHEIKKEKNDDEHKCNEDNVKSAELLINETKPCPRCSARIHRIEGCSAMFCTNCKTCFNWKTGAISKSNSNPHFHEWALSRNNNNLTVPQRGCYNWLNINKDLISSLAFIYKGKIPIKFEINRLNHLWRISDHIQDAVLTRFMTNQVEDSKLLSYRVKYLKKDISPEDWKKNIFMTEKKLEYDTAIYNLYEVVMTVIRETLNKMSKCKTVDEFEEQFKEIEHVINYFNSNSEKISKEFSYSGYDYIEFCPEKNPNQGYTTDYRNHIHNYRPKLASYNNHFSFQQKKHIVNKKVKKDTYLEQKEKKEN